MTASLTLSAADTASLAAGNAVTLTLTGTATATTGTPPPPPPPPPVVTPLPTHLPTTGSNVCYANGKFLWPGDWSGNGVTLNYSGSVDGVECLAILTNETFPYWLPYCPEVGPPKVGGGLTPDLDLSPYQDFIVIARGIAGEANILQMALDTWVLNAQGQATGDVAVPTVGGSTQAAVITSYASAPDANDFVTYTVPLSLWKGAPAINLYKFLLQNQTAKPGDTWYVKYAAFV